MKGLENRPRSFKDLIKETNDFLLSDPAKATLKAYVALLDENNLMKQKMFEIYREDENALLYRGGYLNPAYSKQSNFDRGAFLRRELQGKVLDIGFGGVNELNGVTDDYIYTDLRFYSQNHFVQADARYLPFPDQSFDSIFTAYAMDGYDLLIHVFPEMSRVLRKPGRIVMVPHGHCIPENLRALNDLGVDTLRQCELTLEQYYLQHNSYPLRFHFPSLYIAVDLA